MSDADTSGGVIVVNKKRKITTKESEFKKYAKWIIEFESEHGFWPREELGKDENCRFQEKEFATIMRYIISQYTQRLLTTSHLNHINENHDDYKFIFDSEVRGGTVERMKIQHDSIKPRKESHWSGSNKEVNFKKAAELILSFHNEFGHWPRKSDYVDDKELKLAKSLDNLRYTYKNGTMPSEKLRLIEGNQSKYYFIVQPNHPSFPSEPIVQQIDDVQQIDFALVHEVSPELKKILNLEQFQIIKLSTFQKFFRDDFIKNQKIFRDPKNWRSNIVKSKTKWERLDVSHKVCRMHGTFLQKFMPALTQKVVGDNEATFLPQLMHTTITEFQFGHIDFLRAKEMDRRAGIPEDGYHAYSLHGGGETDCYLHIWPGGEGKFPQKESCLDQPLLVRIPPNYMLALRWDVIHAGHFVHPNDDSNTRFFAYLLPKKGFNPEMHNDFKWNFDWKRYYNNDADSAFASAVPIILKK